VKTGAADLQVVRSKPWIGDEGSAYHAVLFAFSTRSRWSWCARPRSAGPPSNLRGKVTAGHSHFSLVRVALPRLSASALNQMAAKRKKA
jgi:hypothetical protein